MICMKRGIWAQTRQWITANVNCFSRTYGYFWGGHELQIALWMLKSRYWIPVQCAEPPGCFDSIIFGYYIGTCNPLPQSKLPSPRWWIKYTKPVKFCHLSCWYITFLYEVRNIPVTLLQLWGLWGFCLPLVRSSYSFFSSFYPLLCYQSSGMFHVLPQFLLYFHSFIFAYDGIHSIPAASNLFKWPNALDFHFHFIAMKVSKLKQNVLQMKRCSTVRTSKPLVTK